MKQATDNIEQHLSIRPATRSSSTTLLSADDLPTRSRSVRMSESSIDGIVLPKRFSGNKDERVVEWANYFERYAAFKGLKDVQAAALIPLLLDGCASYWYGQQEKSTTADVWKLLDALKQQFSPSPSVVWKQHSDIWNRNQSASKTAEQYIVELAKQATALRLEDTEVIHAVLRGIRPEVRSYICRPDGCPSSRTAQPDDDQEPHRACEDR